MEKTALYLIYFIIYSLIMLIIGKSSLRGENTPQDYFICGKQLSLPFCVATFTGTWISAITILSLTGSIYEDGLPVLGYSVIPWFSGAFLMGLAAGKLYETGAITVPGMLREPSWREKLLSALLKVQRRAPGLTPTLARYSSALLSMPEVTAVPFTVHWR